MSTNDTILELCSVIDGHKTQIAALRLDLGKVTDSRDAWARSYTAVVREREELRVALSDALKQANEARQANARMFDKLGDATREAQKDQLRAKNLSNACDNLAVLREATKAALSSTRQELNDAKRTIADLRRLLREQKENARFTPTGRTKTADPVWQELPKPKTADEINLKAQHAADILYGQTFTGMDPLIAKYPHPLHPILMDVIAQVTKGKGERHGGEAIPFLKQPWVKLAETHGRGFLTGRAEKKLHEAVDRGLKGEDFEREVLGAIAYIGMAVLFERGLS